MSNEIKNIINTINNNNKTYDNNSLINITSNNLLINEKSFNYLLLGIILILIIILIISIFILIFLFKKKKKINYVSNNIGLNKIIINNSNNPNNSNSNIINEKLGFQKVQNTSKVNDIIQPNNVLNEIKTCNLENEIHKIIYNTTSSSSSSLSGEKKLKRKKKVDSKINTNNDKKDLINSKDNINNKKEKDIESNISDVNTQKLEKELKEQIKKYVVEENNI